jgi:CobQ-like glutamine amidotransferase family enzyme
MCQEFPKGERMTKQNQPRLKIVHLYPASMNIYGDTGNVLTVYRRLQLRGFESDVVLVDQGQPLPDDTDIIIAGGGQDTGQLKVAKDLQTKKDQLLAMKEAGVVMFAVCGMYQLFGHWFLTKDGDKIPGVNIFKMTTTAGLERLIGNVTASSDFGDLVGFENHSGETFLEEGQQSLGTVTKGAGNNRKSKDEGAVSVNAFGTYLHGPALPKNPKLTDELIRRALKQQGYTDTLEPIDDELANKAAKIAAARPR